MAVRGGHKLDAIIRRALSASGVETLRVGFFRSAKYPDGTPVAAVAAWNEFGTRTKAGGQAIPERPFFRQALRKVQDDVSELVQDGIDSKTMIVDDLLADRLGGLVAGAVQENIARGTFKALAESTLYRRRTRTVNRTTSVKPLIDTGTMRTSVTWQAQR